MSIEDTLRDTFRTDAVDLVPVGPGPDAARHRAYRHKRRMQSGVVMLSAVALAGGALVAIETRPSGHGAEVRTQPAVTNPELSWRSVDGTVSFSTTHFTTANGVTYALSTAPGMQADQSQPPAQGLYATRDGVTWSNASLPSTRVAGLAENKGVLYSVSTGPGAQGAIGYQLSTSTNGGQKWDDESVPVSFTPPAANVPLTVSNGVQVASQGDTTVVMAEATYDADFAQALKLGSHQSAQVTATGVEVVDSSACTVALAPTATRLPTGAPGTTGTTGTTAEFKATAVVNQVKRRVAECTPKVVSTHPFSEFGITNPAGLHQQKALVRNGSGAWQAATPGIAANAEVTDLTATSNGFLMQEESWSGAPGPMTTQLLSSADGRTWAPLATEAPAAETFAIAGDRIVATSNDGSTIYTSTDAGTTWIPTDNVGSLLPSDAKLTEYGAQVDAGPLGFATVVASGSIDDPHLFLLHSADGTSWKVTDLATVGAPAKGSLQGLVVGADHIDLTFGLSDATPTAGAPAKLVTLVATPKA